LICAPSSARIIERREATNVEQALWRLDEIGLLSYATAKDLYYRARGDDRFRSIILTWPELAGRVPAEVTEDQIFRDLVAAIRELINEESEAKIERGDIVVDVTGGQKPASAAAAAVTLKSRVRFGYEVAPVVKTILCRQ